MADSQLWAYHAETINGALVKGQISAASEQVALSSLREQKLKPIDLHLAHNRGFNALFSRKTSRIGSSQLTTFVRALSDLLGAGVPLSETLSMLEAREKQGDVKALVNRLLEQVRAGQGLSGALKADPVPLPRLMMAMVIAGEATGTLAAQLEYFAAA